MKKSFFAVLLILLLTAMTACSSNLTDKDDIISLYSKNEEAFVQASKSGDFSTLERIFGINKVLVLETYVDIQCGGAGFGPSTHYYGIFYSADDNLCAVDVAGSKDNLKEWGSGYFYQQEDVDNTYYVEPLGNHFFYYEAHF